MTEIPGRWYHPFQKKRSWKRVCNRCTKLFTSETKGRFICDKCNKRNKK